MDECIDTYEVLMAKAFCQFHESPFLRTRKQKYDHRILENAIKEMVAQRDPHGRSDVKFPQDNEDMCRTYVIGHKTFSTVDGF